MGVEGTVGEEVDGVLVHGEKDLVGFDGGGEVGFGRDGGAAGGDFEHLVLADAKAGGVGGVEVEVELLRVEFFQDPGVSGARLGVPLRASAATGEEGEGIVLAGGFGLRGGGIEEEFGAAAGCGERFVGKKAAFLDGILSARFACDERPLDAAVGVEVLVVFDAGDVTGLVGGEFFEDLEGGGGLGPLLEKITATPGMGEKLEDAEVGERLTGSFFHLLHGRDAAFRIDKSAIFFAPGGGGEEEVGRFGGLGGAIHVLDYEEIELFAQLVKAVLVDPRVGRIGGDDPEALDLAGLDSVDDLVVGPAGRGWDAVLGDAKDAADFLAVLGFGKVMPAEQVGGVGEKSAAHGVALPGDGIGPGARFADVASHQAEVDDRLGGADALVRLVDAHGPPKRNTFSLF